MAASSNHHLGAWWRLLVVFGTALLPCSLRAQVVDFETLPDGSPVVDGMLISNQYNAPPYSVSFSLIGQPPSVGPRIAKVGSPMTAFQGPLGTSPCAEGSTRDDMPAPTAAVGCFFLTDDGQTPPAPIGLRVTYAVPVRRASGVLLDVDANSTQSYEEWTVSARRQNDTIINQVILHGTVEADGATSLWQFDSAEDIYFITMEYTGTIPDNVGLAFDHFSTSSLQTDLGVTKSGPAGPIHPGDPLNYVITVTNHGPVLANNVFVQDRLPGGTSFVSAIPSQGSCFEQDGVVTCNLGTLANGGSATIALAAMFVDPLITNTVTVGSVTMAEIDAANNVATSTAAVECGTTAVAGDQAPASLPSRAAPNPAHAGVTIQYVTASGGTNAVEVFDVHGRLIRSLANQADRGGNRSVYWNALDRDGDPVPAGTYFYRVLDHELVINEGKLVLIK